ncbi:MAG: hypothetical protein JRC92_04560 [Deltaproteobacteria bacterium]|nr:hypothetical protein [Deltaproteobacteria bacterium]
MADYLIEIENFIKHLISSDFGAKYSLESKIKDIVEIPFNDFSMLQKSLSSGEAIIRMAPASIDGTTFNIISTPFEKRMSTVYTFITILGPIVGIVLSFVYSWYWLSLTVIVPIVSMKLGKRAYLRALFNRAFNSEIVFSYLFTAGKITIELPGHGILYRKLT